MIFHESKEFIRNLDKFLYEASIISSSYLSSNRTRIPLILRNYTKTLYRGMFLSESEYVDIQAGKFKLERVSSWTKDKTIAQKFVNDTKFIYQRRKKEKVILAKKFMH